jgi:hypothetical protein
VWAAFDIPLGTADPPTDGRQATVWRTITETRTVGRRLQGRPIRWWADRAIQNRRALDGTRMMLRRIRAAQRSRYAPTVRYALALARAVYGYDLTRRTFCESRNDVYAQNGSGADAPRNLLQFRPSTWRTTPFAGFSIFDPVAAELAGGWMIRAGRSGEWSCHL